MKVKVYRFKNLEDLSWQAAEAISIGAVESVTKKGSFTLMLSGGNSPRETYRALGRPPQSLAMPWPYIHLFWGDERCVPSEHEESNYGNAYRDFIGQVFIPPENIHRIICENKSPEDAAQDYEKKVRDFFNSRERKCSDNIRGDQVCRLPVFDMIILGLGKDGHTASLFPESSAIEEMEKWFTSTESSLATPAIDRITVTLPVINAASTVIFIVAGKGKKRILNSILNNTKTSKRYPASGVQPGGKLIWYILE
jgi:6-phosphogluconolactonase